MTPYQRKQFLSDYVARSGQTWSTLRNEPRRFPVRRIGDGFVYHPAASHDDPVAFRRRQEERVTSLRPQRLLAAAAETPAVISVAPEALEQERARGR